ncbi:MAG: ammonia monooxygenase [Aquincola sp.]|nr:ammonia monooxygenase [Aquincola sp.]
MWWCPGCDGAHTVVAHVVSGTLPTPEADAPDWTPPADFYTGPGWTWNGSAARPTFMPSVLVTYDGADAGQDGAPPAVCHCFVVDGQMQMLGDCTHGLAGQTVPIPPWHEG